ncbi:MAG: hypothetical protein HRU48_04740 [Vibrio sp.]|uniref:hypothetical protein n=1 Tax=Vibrio TaxID=662 RepID=UPI001EBE6491|nr:hypothetical protein [Vibrio sp.]NRB66669.1 hypothetical protein [Vibrio sp.]
METPHDEPVITPPELDERDQTAQAAIDAMQQQAQSTLDSEQSHATQSDEEATDFDDETSRQMLSYGLGMIEMTVGAVFDVSFEIEERAGNKWLDAATPMLKKYGPLGLEWFAKYQTEVMFALSSCSLVGGCATQVRRLKKAQADLAAQEAKEAQEAHREEETDEATVTSEQEQPSSA